VRPRGSATFPFTAIVGQETLKTALLVNAVDPRVGGVLIRGEKGTAKSTAVRALAAVLPPIRVVEGCAFACDPNDEPNLCDECRTRAEQGPLPVEERRPRVVDLPVSATEDRVVGTLDLEHALKHGERRFEPGLLASANRGVLYVDEVNLLDDHVTDTLLDSAAMGVNIVEREGVAFSHAARFILVGTMNPEEGDVRPQLLDRFGLCADVTGLNLPAERVEIMERRAAFEDDPARFASKWEPAQRELERSIARAVELLPRVKVSRDILFLIANVGTQMEVDGHRADLTMARAAASLTALEGREEVTIEDVRRVAPLVLAHRMRRRPFEEVSVDQLRLDAIVSAGGGEEGGAGTPEPSGEPADGAQAAASARLVSIGEEAAAAEQPTAAMVTPLDRLRRNGPGRRQETRSDDGRGRYTRTEAPKSGRTSDVALDATLREAAPKQSGRSGDMAINVEPADVRAKVRNRKVGSTIVLCVDASGSMGAAERMEAAKAAALSLLADAYQRRDRVGLVSFRGDGAEVLLAPTSSVELAQVKLKNMPVGGATPLAHGIAKSLELLATEVRRDPRAVPWLVIATDGRANVGLTGGLGSEDAKVQAAKVKAQGIHAIVLDTTEGRASGAAAREIARQAGAEYVRLARNDGNAIASAVRERLEAV
jgi:magnesium chelatase subunit D